MMNETFSIEEHAGLPDLLSDEFLSYAVVASTGSALRARLQNNDVVRGVRAAVALGQIVDGDIDAFVSGILAHFKSGVRFPYQGALAAIGVVFESTYSPFADEFLDNLSSVKLVEFALAASSARESAQARAGRSRTVARVLYFPTKAPVEEQWVQAHDAALGDSIIRDSSASQAFVSHG